MKKYFATTIIAAVMFSISLVSCAKDVSGTNNANKANTGNESNMVKKPNPIIWPDTTIAKK